MANTIVRRLETAANVCIIVVSIILGMVLVRHFVFNRIPDGNSQSTGHYISKGQKMTLKDIDWTRNGQTLLLVLQKDCHFCSESASFYKTLVQDAAKRGSVHVVAVLPQTIEVGKKYLGELGVPIDDVRQEIPTAMGVQGTPTLILVNNAGVASEIWMGKLSQEKEAEVLSRL